MPGHVKKTTGPDPDPDPWLIVTDTLRAKLKAKPYDAKKSCWVPEKSTGGFSEGLIESTDGDKVTVKILESGDVSSDSKLFFVQYLVSIISSQPCIRCPFALSHVRHHAHVHIRQEKSNSVLLLIDR